MKIINHILLGLLCLIATPLVAQEDAWDELKKLNQSIQNAERLSTSFTMEIYQDSRQLQSSQGSILKDGAFSKTEFRGELTITGPDFHMLVNQREKSIWFQQFDPEKVTSQAPAVNLTEWFDALKSADGVVASKVQTSSGDAIAVIMKQDPQFRRILIYTDDTGTVLRRIEYEMKNTVPVDYDRIVFEYPTMTLNQKASSREFDWKRYVQIKKGEAQPTSAYAAYRMIN